MKHVKLKRTTVEARVSAAKNHAEGYKVPKGCKELMGIDADRWKSLCFARDAWTDTELLMLYELILTFRDLDSARDEARDCPVMEYGRVHPIHEEVRRREKALQAWFRNLGLNTTLERANAGNAASRKAQVDDDELPSNVASLLG
jgi:hypothetical protein